MFAEQLLATTSNTKQQDKTRQSRTKQDKAGQNKTKQSKQSKTRQSRAKRKFLFVLGMLGVWYKEKQASSRFRISPISNIHGSNLRLDLSNLTFGYGIWSTFCVACFRIFMAYYCLKTHPALKSAFFVMN